MTESSSRRATRDARVHRGELPLHASRTSSWATATSCSTSGVIDSLGFVELVEEVQARYGIDDRRRRDHRGELRLDRRDRAFVAAKRRGGCERPDRSTEDLRGGARRRDPARRRRIVAGDRASPTRELDRRGRAASPPGLRAHRRARAATASAIVLPNGVERAIAIYGVLRAGAAFTPLNPTAKPTACLPADRAELRRGRDAELRRRARAEHAVRRPPAVAQAGPGRRRRAVVAAGEAPRERAGAVDLGGDHLHVGLDRRAEGGRRSPTRNMRFVAGSIVEYLRADRAPTASSACCRCRSTTASTS